ncbi:MAG: MBL fold metallo-hydrolase [Eggerthellaceae bacterium]
MVDSGEDDDYPDGSDPRYPLRPGITQGHGHQDEVVAYMRSIGVTEDNFDFYIGTHPHSDHIGSADEVIRAFHPKRVYVPEYKDEYISYDPALWDNRYVYDRMIEAAYEVGATVIWGLDPSPRILGC